MTSRLSGLFRLSFVGALGFSLLGGCSNNDDDDVCTDQVQTLADDDADFSSYETFAVFEIGTTGVGGAGGSSGIPSDLPEDVTANIETANKEAVRQLKALGLSEVDPEEETPDLWVLSAALTEEEEGTYWQCVPGWYWWGWYYYWDPCAWTVPVDFEYTQGTLLVAVVDAADEKPVFGGVLEGILECTDEHEIDDRIEAGVDEIFDDYPQD